MTVFPPKKILVPFDFSIGSLRAWRYALALAGRVHAELEALYVSPWLSAPDVVFVQATLTQAQRLEIDRKLKARLGPDVVAHIAEGDIVSEILRTAKEQEADLIIMATAGRTGLRRAILGSVAEAVVRLSPIPVLSLCRAERKLPRAILAPVNLEPYSMAGVQVANAVAKALDGRVTLFYVKEGRSKEAFQGLRDLGLKTKIVDGKPVRGIIEESGKHDLLVMVAHRRGIFRDGLLGTTAEQVLRHCEVPVLCVPAPLPAERKFAEKRSVMSKRKISKRRVVKPDAFRHTRSRKRGTRSWTTWTSESRMDAPKRPARPGAVWK